MSIKELIEKIKVMSDCKVYQPMGLPELEDDRHKLPEDVVEFYENCGGMSLFISEGYVANIVEPNEFKLANPIIVGELCEDDITSEWYVIVNDGNGDYLTIDLSNNRIGRCYDSYWDRHGVVGECPIIAKTFTELLERLILNEGKRWYWLREDFISMGDAYDNVDED